VPPCTFEFHEDRSRLCQPEQIAPAVQAGFHSPLQIEPELQLSEPAILAHTAVWYIGRVTGKGY
jgi:hypothetical protein